MTVALTHGEAKMLEVILGLSCHAQEAFATRIAANIGYELVADRGVAQPPIRYDTASKEPLEVIRLNECEASPSLATSRFQALWNEIVRLRTDLIDASDKLAKIAALVE